MTNRERILAILDGSPPDRVPWIPRFGIWHKARLATGTLPERYRGMSLRELERDLGVGTPAREGTIFVHEYRGVEVRSQPVDEMNTVTEYVTPVGTLSTLDRRSALLADKGIRGMDVGHLVKGPEDYEIIEYLVENEEYRPTYEEYLQYEADVGDDGYPLVNCGDCPFHFWLRTLVGYNRAYLHLSDFPGKVERLLDLLTQRDREKVWPLMAESPARMLLHGAHFSSSMTPPPMYERYILPYYEELSEFLRGSGKTLCLHADADSRLILDQIKRSGYGMAETFTTEPMVSCTLEQGRRAFGGDVIIWGGVPSVILEENYSDEYFEAYMRKVFRTIAPGDAFILGVADNVLPDADIERIRRISEMVEEWGEYPVRGEDVGGA